MNKEELKVLEERSAKGDSEATNLLANYHINTSDSDSNKAFELFSLANKQAFEQEKVNIIKAYSDSGIVLNSPLATVYVINSKEDEKTLVDNINKGHTHDILSLAIVYYEEKKYTLALEYLNKALDQKLFQAHYYLGLMNYFGLGKTIDYLQARNHFLSVNDKVAEATYYLGLIEYNGFLGKTNFPAALKYFNEAINLGSQNATYFLGVCYYYGRGGLAINYVKAFELFSQAAKDKNPEALNFLGVCYFYGKGVTLDYKAALFYYNQAANLNNAQALYNAGYCYQYGYGTNVDLAKAKALYQKSASLGNNNAQNALKLIN